MKNRIVIGKWMCCVVFVFFYRCAGSLQQKGSEALLPEIDVVQVKENSEEALKLAQEAKLDVEVLNTKLIDIDNRLISLQEDVAAVSAAKMEEIENRLTLLVEAMKELQQQVQSLESSLGLRKKPPTFSPSAASVILQPSAEYDMYQNALRLYNARKYREALELFSKIIAQYPQGAYSDNCHYWMGECYYGLGDYSNAAAVFNKVLTFDKTSKADDAQLKLGLCYLKMGQQSIARTEFQKLVDRYPASEYVPRAKKYLEELK